MRLLAINSRLSDRGGADRWLIGVLAALQGRIETALAVGYVDKAMPLSEAARVGPTTSIKGLDGRGLRGGGVANTIASLGATVDDFDPHAILVNDVTHPDLLDAIAETGLATMVVQDHRFFCPGRGKIDLDDALCRQPMGESCGRCFEDDDYGRALLALTRRRLAVVSKIAASGRIVVLSQYMRDELAEAGIDPWRVHVLPPFVDGLDVSGETRCHLGQHHLLAGRLSAHKGTPTALRAAGRLTEAAPLAVVGDGRMVDDVTATPGVQFLGWADRAHLVERLDRSISMWLPSRWAEPFGIIGIEAMARGVPVIGSRIGGIPEWLEHGVTGFLVEPGAGAEIAERADALARDSELARRMGDAGRQRVRDRYDRERSVARLLKLLGA